jgi:hypothetical protein
MILADPSLSLMGLKQGPGFWTDDLGSRPDARGAFVGGE